MALLIVAGTSPVTPFSQAFERSAITASAAPGDIVEQGNCGTEGHESDVTWTLTKNADDETKYTLTISGTGDMMLYNPIKTPKAPWDSVKGSVASIVIGDGVTSIGNYAFYKFTNLTSLSIAGTVTSIGDSAFEGCSSLANVTVPASVTSIGECAFYRCESLTSINIPDNVTSIGKYAFLQCTSLESLIIPESVTSIDDGVFNRDTNLTSLTYGGSAAEWAALTGNVKLGMPEGCTMTYLKKDVAIDGNIINGTVTADKAVVSPDETVTLTVTPDEGYAVKSVKYNDTVIEPVEGVYSFTMPAEDVTVSAEFVPCISNVSVTLKDDLGLNFIVGNVTDNNKDNFRIKLTGNCNEDGEVLPLNAKQIGDQTVYCVTANVTANHMHEEITAELYYVDGENETLIGTKKYSVYDYLKTQYDELLKLDSMSNQQRDLSILLSRTMTYGNVAEFYFNNAEKNFSILDSDNYSTFNIITLLQELGVKNLKKGIPPEIVNDEAKVSLVLDSKMSSRLYIKGLTAGVQDDNGEYTSVAGTKGGTDYPAYFEIQNINVTELTDNIAITYNGEKYTFSPLTWAYRVLLNEKSTEKNVYMAKALALYADAAADYVNSLS